MSPAAPTKAPASDVAKAIEEVIERTPESQTEDSRPAREIARREFLYWVAKARRAGVSVPDDFALPPALYEPFAEAFREYDSALRLVDKARLPAVNRIVDRKRAAGAYESFPHPGTFSDPKAARTARKAIRLARKPTRKYQSVTMSGDGRILNIIRVDAYEDPSLLPLYHALDDAERTYIARVHMLLVPYLRR